VKRGIATKDGNDHQEPRDLSRVAAVVFGMQVERRRPAFGRSLARGFHRSSPLWRSSWLFDGFGRAFREVTNGIQTREVRRRAGGQAFATRAVGQRWMYSTTNAEGVTVFEEDEDDETTTVRTAVPGSRLMTVSRISKGGGQLLTTSLVRRLDVLGDVVLETETGEGTSQKRLSRDTDFFRDASGWSAFLREYCSSSWAT